MQPLQHPLFAQFIVYFNENQDYFECHEVLEEYWKSIPNSTKEHPLTTFILLATGLYHFRRGNTKGALRTLQKAYAKMTHPSSGFSEFTKGIDGKQLMKNLGQTIQRLESNESFEPFLISISSSKLTLLVYEVRPTMTLLPFGSDIVLHKHMLRDRSDILLAREKAKSEGTARYRQSLGEN
ncbi:DUF309 domain-containing protein [Sporosarcina sp. CAU 1771]